MIIPTIITTSLIHLGEYVFFSLGVSAFEGTFFLTAPLGADTCSFSCWISSRNGLIWTFVGPVIIIFIVRDTDVGIFCVHKLKSYTFLYRTRLSSQLYANDFRFTVWEENENQIEGRCYDTASSNSHANTFSPTGQSKMYPITWYNTTWAIVLQYKVIYRPNVPRKRIPVLSWQVNVTVIILVGRELSRLAAVDNEGINKNK